MPVDSQAFPVPPPPCAGKIMDPALKPGVSWLQTLQQRTLCQGLQEITLTGRWPQCYHTAPCRRRPRVRVREGDEPQARGALRPWLGADPRSHELTPAGCGWAL